MPTDRRAPDVDRELVDFLHETRSERDLGFTLPNLFRSIQTIANGLSVHEADCLRYRRENDARITAYETATDARIAILERAAEEAAMRPSAPPARATEISTLDLERFAKEVAEKALEGAARPDSTPEEAIQPIVDDALARREERRELERLQREEVERIEAAKKRRDDEAAAAQRISEARATTRRNALATVFGSVSLTLLYEVVKWLAAHYH